MATWVPNQVARGHWATINISDSLQKNGREMKVLVECTCTYLFSTRRWFSALAFRYSLDWTDAVVMIPINPKYNQHKEFRTTFSLDVKKIE